MVASLSCLLVPVLCVEGCLDLFRLGYWLHGGSCELHPSNVVLHY